MADLSVRWGDGRFSEMRGDLDYWGNDFEMGELKPLYGLCFL